MKQEGGGGKNKLKGGSGSFLVLILALSKGSKALKGCLAELGVGRDKRSEKMRETSRKYLDCQAELYFPKRREYISILKAWSR